MPNMNQNGGASSGDGWVEQGYSSPPGSGGTPAPSGQPEPGGAVPGYTAPGWTPPGSAPADTYVAPGATKGPMEGTDWYNLIRQQGLGVASQPALPRPEKYTQNPYYLRALNQQLGFDPQAMAGLRSGIDTMAGQAYERGLSPLKRQQAMMGATGTGADMVANNALGAQINETAMQQRQGLDLANMQQIERDLSGSASLALQGQQADFAQQQFQAEQSRAIQELGTELWANIETSINNWPNGTTLENARYIYNAGISQASQQAAQGDYMGALQTMTSAVSAMGMPANVASAFLAEFGKGISGGGQGYSTY